MNIQGSINQLLILSAAAAKTSSFLKDKEKLKSLDRRAEKLSAIIEDEEWGEQKDIDTLYQIKEEAFHINPSEKRYKELGDLYKATTEGMEEKQLSKQAEKEKQAKHEEFAQKFSEGIGFNPVQREEPSWRRAAKQAEFSLSQQQEEKRAGRRILYDKHITGGSL